MEATRRKKPGATIEILIPDFHGNREAWQTVLEIQPEIFNYNLETVRSLTPKVRHTATHDRTLAFLSYAREHSRNPHMKIKSGFMVGLGETDDEVKQALTDLHHTGVDIVTIGQYLRPTARHLPVVRWWEPEHFDRWAAVGEGLGIAHVVASPLTRSSYHAKSAAGAASTPSAAPMVAP